MKENKNFKRLMVLVIAVAFCFLGFDGDTSVGAGDTSVGADDQASIWTTDEYGNPQNDFPPDSNVYIHGAGFNPTSAITINITRPDTIVITFYNSSDFEGNFICIYDLNGLEGEYTVNATDGSNSAQVTFTDSPEPITYKDSSYNNRIAVFHPSDTVFAKVSSGSHQTKFVWRNTTGQIVQQSSTWLTSSPFTDSYDLPSDAVVGTWTVTRWSRHGKPGNWKYKNVTRDFYVIESNKFIPDYDSWVEENKPDDNKGDDETLHVRYDNNNEERWTYLKFNLSSIPTDSTITNANLYLYPKGNHENRALGVYYISDDSWNENDPNGIDWNNRPTPPGSQIDSTSVGYQIWANWDLSTQVQSEIDSVGDKILSMVLYFPTYHCDNHKDFYSAEEDDTSDYKGPYLVIDYEVQYTLNITIVGNGSVAKNPDQATYTYGTLVELTAVADPGWTFAGWSGDLSGSDNPETINMTSDKDVTATFTEDQYTLTIGIDGNGSVIRDPDLSTYTYGTVVELTAVPDVGSTFAGWSGPDAGDLVPVLSSWTITMNSNKQLTATFTQIPYTLDIAIVGSGTVTKAPDQATYTYGTVVTLTPEPAVGWTFAGWSGPDAGDLVPVLSSWTITMNSNKQLTATFTQIPYTLDIAIVGSGTVTKAPDQATYTYGTVVTLTPEPAVGWTFAGWSGPDAGDLVPVLSSWTITMNSNKQLTATFTQIPYTLDIAIVGSGTVTKAPDQATYTYGTVVTLTPEPAVGWTFAGWSGPDAGDLVPVLSSWTITMNSNKQLTATFTQIPYTLDIAIVGSGTVTKAPDQATYTYGTVVTLTPEPAVGWTFAGWSGPDAGDLVPVLSSWTITMNSNKQLTATFTQIPYTLDIAIVGSGTVTKAPDQATYTYGTVVTLTPEPAVGWTFAGWSGPDAGDLVPVLSSWTITMNSNKQLTATFTQIPYTLDIAIVGSGTVTKAPDQATYTYGTVVTLTPEPAVGWTFAGWSGDLSGSATPDTLAMTKDMDVDAEFTLNGPYTLSMTTSGTGSGTVEVSPGGPYYYGDVVTLWANASVGSTFAGWSGDLSGSTTPKSIVMDGDKTVTAWFWLKEEGLININGSMNPPLPLLTGVNMIDYVAFGEKATASDGVDGHDLPYPGTPPAPYVAGWFMTDFVDPYDELEKDIRHYPAVPPNEKIWDLWVETDTAGNGETTLVTMTWNTIIQSVDEYDYVILRDYLSGDTLVDMRAAGTFVFTADHGMGYHFEIVCGWNHCPVAVDDEYDAVQDMLLTVAAPGVKDNDYDDEGDPFDAVNPSDPTHGTVNYLNTDGSFEYEPDPGYYGMDSFTYEVTDGASCFDEATVTITVLRACHIDVNIGWNLISIPASEENFDKTSFFVEFPVGSDVYYSWADAITNGYILDFIYGWTGGASGVYFDEAYLDPGEGYWLWAYEDCTLIMYSDAPEDNHITTFDDGEGWYLVGAPYMYNLAKWNTWIHYAALDYSWTQASNPTNNIILEYLYDWNRATQNYDVSVNPDFFESGRGYWMYVYKQCSLKKA